MNTLTLKKGTNRLHMVSMCIIIDALMDTVMEYFHITEVQLEEFTASFVQRLPQYMQDVLERKETAA